VSTTEDSGTIEPAIIAPLQNIVWESMLVAAVFEDDGRMEGCGGRAVAG